MNYRLIVMHKILGVAFAGLGLVAALSVPLYLPERFSEHGTIIGMTFGLGIPVGLDVAYRLLRFKSNSFTHRMLSPEMGAHYYLLPVWVWIIGLSAIYFVMQQIPMSF